MVSVAARHLGNQFAGSQVRSMKSNADIGLHIPTVRLAGTFSSFACPANTTIVAFAMHGMGYKRFLSE